MTHSSLQRIAEVIQEVIESEIASQLDDLKAEVSDLTTQIEDYDHKLNQNEELVDDERVRDLIRDFVNDGGLEITTT
jgi:phage host-nuclease inhibitor protein Gam